MWKGICNMTSLRQGLAVPSMAWNKWSSSSASQVLRFQLSTTMPSDHNLWVRKIESERESERVREREIYLLSNIHLYVLICVSEPIPHATVCPWRSKENLWDSVLPLHPVVTYQDRSPGLAPSALPYEPGVNVPVFQVTVVLLKYALGPVSWFSG